MNPAMPHNPDDYNAPLRIALIRLSLKQCLIEKLEQYNQIGVENLGSYDLDYYRALQQLPERIAITLVAATICLSQPHPLNAFRRHAAEYVDTADMVIDPHVEEEAARMHAENLAAYKADRERADKRRADIARDARNPSRN